MYHWTNTNLQRPDGLYADHLSLSGAVDPTIWSYNQGVAVGVNVLLYEVTNDRDYLAEAERIASAASRYFAQQGRLAGQPASFNSIYFRNLLMLESVTGGSTYRRAAQSYADAVWASDRDPETGLFHFGSDHTQTLEQSAMIQLYAVLNWTRPQWRNLY